MNLLQKLFGSTSVRSEQRVYTFSVKCKRCGEVIQGRVDLSNDLSEDGEIFHTRKILIGENRCFQRMEVELKFTPARELIERQVTGGDFI